MPTRRTFLETLALALTPASLLSGEETRRRSRWEIIAHDEPSVNPDYHPEPASWSDSTITAAWIGHSTVLINFFGFWILTDPVFSERIGLDVAGLFTIGPRRLVKPAMSVSELPPVDLILLSHAHLDHCDLPTLDQLPKNVPLVMAKNTSDLVADLGFETVYELDWTQWTRIGDVRIEALEVKHFGWRYPWEPDRSRGYHDGRSYNAYLLSRNGHQIVFGGDTAYHEKFREIRNRGLAVDLAILPIGAYDPWIANHASPEQALALADQLQAYHILPIHWSTFIQSQEPTSEPINRLRKATEKHPERIVMTAVGQTWSLNRTIAVRRNPREPVRLSRPLYTRNPAV